MLIDVDASFARNGSIRDLVRRLISPPVGGIESLVEIDRTATRCRCRNVRFRLTARNASNPLQSARIGHRSLVGQPITAKIRRPLELADRSTAKCRTATPVAIASGVSSGLGGLGLQDRADTGAIEVAPGCKRSPRSSSRFRASLLDGEVRHR